MLRRFEKWETVKLGTESGIFQLGVSRIKDGNLQGSFSDILTVVRGVDDFSEGVSGFELFGSAIF